MELRHQRWQETSSFDKLFNFKWQQWSRGVQFDLVNSCGTRQLINHYQNHQILTTKHQLFECMTSHCELNKVNVFDYLPITFSL